MLKSAFAVAIALLFASCSAQAADFPHGNLDRGDLVAFPTRSGVTQGIYIESPSQAPKAAVLIYAGGGGVLALDSSGATAEKGNFVVATARFWVDQGYAAVLVDAPSDMVRLGMTDGFRLSSDTLIDQKAVIDHVKARFPSARIVMISTSRGTVTVGNVLAHHPEWADLYVLTSAEHSGPRDIRGISNIVVPEAYRDRTLAVANRNDVCYVAGFSSNKTWAEKNKVAFIAEETHEGGGDMKAECGARSPHGYLGGRDKVLQDMEGWIAPALHKLDRQ
jgi:hypothetical protein